MTPLRPEKGDDPGAYQTAVCFTPGREPYVILDRHPNGDCVYLNESGCTIHDRAPFECRRYDCRAMFKNSDREGRRDAVRQGRVPRAIFRRGKELSR